MTDFVVFDMMGADAQSFLQGQLTCNVNKLDSLYQATAICNLKGRVAFGLWVKKAADAHYQLVISQDCGDDFAKHIKKYAAFSKLTLSKAREIFFHIDNQTPSFSETDTGTSLTDWQQLSIAAGNYWLVKATEGLWQPQELRLHQRGGVDYDKGCYLGQEIVARLYFKASPKAWLHRVAATNHPVVAAGEKIGAVEVVSSVVTDTGFEALVVARPEDIHASGLTVLELPEPLQQPVARQ